MSAPANTVIIIAGPNGAGKTTFARAFLAQSGMRFINADLIAAGLSPFAPEPMALRAGRLMLEEIAASTVADDSFAFETTLSGLGWLRHIRQWRSGYVRVVMRFQSLSFAAGLWPDCATLTNTTNPLYMRGSITTIQIIPLFYWRREKTYELTTSASSCQCDGHPGSNRGIAPRRRDGAKNCH